MPRKARLDAAGALHHIIIIRGIERRKIFRDDSDRDTFLNRLAGILLDSQTRCFAWVLKSNHFHLLLCTGLVPISNVHAAASDGLRGQLQPEAPAERALVSKPVQVHSLPGRRVPVGVGALHPLQPLRAKVVSNLGELDRYRFCGHSVLMGRCRADWQDTAYVLKLFGGHSTQERKRYREFVQKEAQRGRRAELSGGGLVRSMRGWKAIQAMRDSGERTLGNKRILGDGDFVETALAAGSERLERRSLLKGKGYDFERIAERVAVIFDMPLSEVLREGKYARTVAA